MVITSSGPYTLTQTIIRSYIKVTTIIEYLQKDLAHLPVEKDLRGVARASKSGEAEVSRKNSQAAKGREKANTEVDIGKNCSKFVAKLSTREGPIAVSETLSAVSRCIARFFVAKDTRLVEVVHLSTNGVGGEVAHVIRPTDTRHSSALSPSSPSEICHHLRNCIKLAIAHAQIWSTSGARKAQIGGNFDQKKPQQQKK